MEYKVTNENEYVFKASKILHIFCLLISERDGMTQMGNGEIGRISLA